MGVRSPSVGITGGYDLADLGPLEEQVLNH